MLTFDQNKQLEINASDKPYCNFSLLYDCLCGTYSDMSRISGYWPSRTMVK